MEFRKAYLSEIDKRVSVTSAFMRETLFPVYDETAGTIAQWTVFDNGNAILPDAVVGAQAGRVGPGGYQLRTASIPKAFGSMTTSEYDLDLLEGGYSPYRSDAELVADLQAREIRELELACTRREELMCAQAVVEGRVVSYDEHGNVLDTIPFWNTPVTGDGVDDPIATAGTQWAAGRNNLSDFLTWANIIANHGGTHPNVAIMAPNVAQALMSGSDFEKNIGGSQNLTANIDLTFETPGVAYIGEYMGIRLFANGMSVNVGGVSKRLIQDGYLVLGSTQSDNRLIYGPNRAKDGDRLVRVIGRRCLYSEIGGNPPAISHYLACRPLAVCRRKWDNYVITGLV